MNCDDNLPPAVLALFDQPATMDDVCEFVAAVNLEETLRGVTHTVAEWQVAPSLVYDDLKLIHQIFERCVCFSHESFGCGRYVIKTRVVMAMAAGWLLHDFGIRLKGVAGRLQIPVDWQVLHRLSEAVRQAIMEGDDAAASELWNAESAFETELASLKHFAELFRQDDDVPPQHQRSHSEHFDSVVWDGVAYTFTPKQAKVVELLWTAWENGGQSVLTVELMDAADSAGNRLRDVFKSGRNVHAAWNTMIISDGKGHYKLSAGIAAESR